jgi:hypothetical protein
MSIALLSELAIDVYFQAHDIREVELAANDAHSRTAQARKRAKARSKSAREHAIRLQDSVNDNHDCKTLRKIYQIADKHEANVKLQKSEARRNSEQAAIHLHNAGQDQFGDKTQRRHARKQARRLIKDAKEGKKAAEESYTHTHNTIGFLKLGQQHLDSMSKLGHKHPDTDAHHQGFQNCVHNAAEPEPSRRELKKARKNFNALTNVGLLGFEHVG